MTTSLKRRTTALAAVVVTATLALTTFGSSASAAMTTGATTSATTGPDDANTTSDTRLVEAENGTIEVPAAPQRVATLGRSTASFLDLGGQPVGVTQLGDNDFAALSEAHQAAYNAATLLGATASEADLELLATLEPDLIVISVPQADYEQMKAQLQAIAPTVWFGFDSDWTVRLAMLADATNLTDVLDEQRAGYEERVARIQQTYADLIANTTFGEVSRNFWEDQPGVFLLNGSLCTEVARADLGLDIPDVGENGEERSFEQIGELSEFDVILYPVDRDGNVSENFVSMSEANAWKALPLVISGHAVGVYCPWSRSYNFYSQYMDSLERALASLPASEE